MTDVTVDQISLVGLSAQDTPLYDKTVGELALECFEAAEFTLEAWNAMSEAQRVNAFDAFIGAMYAPVDVEPQDAFAFDEADRYVGTSADGTDV